TSFVRPSQTVHIDPAGVDFTMVADVAGASGPGPGHAEAEAGAISSTIVIRNLLDVAIRSLSFNVNVTYDLLASADPDSTADASFGVSLTSQPSLEVRGLGRGVSAPPNMSEKAVSTIMVQTGDIASFATAEIEMRLFVRGSATTSAIPEANSVYLVPSGIL